MPLAITSPSKGDKKGKGSKSNLQKTPEKSASGTDLESTTSSTSSGKLFVDALESVSKHIGIYVLSDWESGALCLLVGGMCLCVCLCLYVYCLATKTLNLNGKLEVEWVARVTDNKISCLSIHSCCTILSVTCN